MPDTKHGHGRWSLSKKNFQREIKAITSGIRLRRGLPLTNSSRALNIARSSRRIAKLHVFDQVQASRLVQFGKYGRFLGNGLAVIDFGSRVGNIHNSYKAGDNWYREMFIESTSFAASARVGVVAANVGAFLVALTPFGWIGLIVDFVLFVFFGQKTVRKLRKNPATKDFLGIEPISGWDIFHVANALALPRWLTRKVRQSRLAAFFADVFSVNGICGMRKNLWAEGTKWKPSGFSIFVISGA